VLLVSLICASIVAACLDQVSPQEFKLSRDDSGSTMEASPRDQIVVTLHADPATGYAWTIAGDLDASVVRLDHEQFQPAFFASASLPSAS